jgi:hypothetical protein
LHLIRRREVRRIAFPAVRYLRRAEKRHAKRLRLRQLLLLATRVAIVLLLAAAAAGPLIGRGSAADHRPTALAIVIDDSQSSSQLADGRRLLDEFVERVSLTLDLTTADDRLALISAAAGDQPLIIQGPNAIREYLSNAQPMAARADLPTAVTRGEAWARSVAEGRAIEIHVLTDLQASYLLTFLRRCWKRTGQSVNWSPR